jgi:hypothetical protein
VSPRAPLSDRRDVQDALSAPESAAKRLGFDAVPKEKREEIVAQILAMPVISREGVSRICLYIVAQLLGGYITTAQADSARKWVELMVTNLTLDMFEKNPAYQQAAAKSGGGGTGVPANDVLARLAAVEKQSRKITKKQLVIDVKE